MNMERAGDGIQAILYILLLTGVTAVFWRDIRMGVLKIQLHRRLRLRSDKPEKRLLQHLRLLMDTISNGRLSEKSLILISCCLALAVTVTGFRSCSVGLSVFFGGMIGLMPYVLCRIRLESIRRAASFEGEAFVTMLLSKYRIASFNMQRALELLADDGHAPEAAKRFIPNILLNIRTTGEKTKIKEAFRRFEFAIDTNWSRMTAYNMALSCENGLDVSDALEDIVLQLREARNMTEERKRMNAETGRLVSFMVPVSYVFSMFLSIHCVGVGASKLFHNQFLTPQGFAFFIFIVFLFLINVAILKIVGNKRFDY